MIAEGTADTVSNDHVCIEIGGGLLHLKSRAEHAAQANAITEAQQDWIRKQGLLIALHEKVREKQEEVSESAY